MREAKNSSFKEKTAESGSTTARVRKNRR
uniref:Uncharacterized protein n=1 Tax=Rhizophora mucronata TaxID=61149 RepID=A0A2P2Q1X4_RHIMU